MMPTSRTASRGQSPVGFEAVGSGGPIALSEITTLTSLTESLLRDYDALVARSGTGLRSCKEVHAFLKERSVIEATYGNALVRQARASAGSLERGTCRMGWFAFKSMSESIGRKHLVRQPPTAHRPPPTGAPRLAALQLAALWPKPLPPPWRRSWPPTTTQTARHCSTCVTGWLERTGASSRRAQARGPCLDTRAHGVSQAPVAASS